jgi:organic radical activating enzyme
MITGSLEITTVLGCKNMCEYCPQEKLIHAYKLKSNEKVMSLDLFKTCLNKIPQSIHIHFSGFAEPWLNPYCTEMITFANKNGFSLAVYTTGLGLSLSDIKSILHIPFSKFVVHLPDAQNLIKIKITDAYLNVIEKLSNSHINSL